MYWSDDDSLECPFVLGWAPPLWSLCFIELRIASADGFDWCIYILSPSHSLSLYWSTFLCFSWITRQRWHPFLKEVFDCNEKVVLYCMVWYVDIVLVFECDVLSIRFWIVPLLARLVYSVVCCFFFLSVIKQYRMLEWTQTLILLYCDR